MEIQKWMSMLFQFLILVPTVISCYLSAKNQLKYTPAKTAALCSAAFLPCFAIAAFLHRFASVDIKAIILLSLLPFFFLYRHTVTLDLPRALSIFLGVCAIETFPAQFSFSFDSVLHPASGAANLSAEAAFFWLVLSCLLLTAFAHPARRHFSWAVDNLDFPKIWYSTVALSSFFLILNILAIPHSYRTLHTGRMYWLFPLFEAGAMIVLVTFYILYYRGATIILEHANLKERSQLLEMQSHQYFALQEHVHQTAKLRHDFRHSIALLASLTKKGDIDSIQAYIAQYEIELDGHSIKNYCSNTALDALFGYYHDLAVSAGIDINWNIELPEPMLFGELDMAALFGNLIENAIAGCQTLPKPSRYFCLTAEILHGSALYVVSTNNFDGKVRKGKNGYRSTKHSGTGIGLASVTAIAEKYNGSVKASNSDTEFFVDVVLKF